MSKPLDGIKVVELANFVAAPTAARMLSAMGADVIKIEATGGDAWRLTGRALSKHGDEEDPFYDLFNLDKHSVGLNIKDPQAFEALMKLIAKADVFVTNTRAKSLVKLGLDADTLRAKFPRLIYAYIDGFGNKGPEANSPGFDNLAFWSRSGFAQDMIIQTEDSRPLFAPTSVGDTITGTFLFSGIVTALFAREKTGVGDTISASLYHAAIWAMNGMIMRAYPQYGETFPKKKLDCGPLTNNYRCADGEWCNIVILEIDKYCKPLFDVLGIREKTDALGIVNGAGVRDHKEELIPLIEAAFATKPVAYWEEKLHEVNIVGGRLAHFKDVLNDEQAWANDFLQEYKCRDGVVAPLPTPPVKLASVPLEEPQWAELTGESTDRILSELGYSDTEIADMHARGAIV